MRDLNRRLCFIWGEIPAAAIIEGLTRLIPGIPENMESINNDSFCDHLLDHPHYTSLMK